MINEMSRGRMYILEVEVVRISVNPTDVAVAEASYGLAPVSVSLAVSS
jgi:hypothetical protein